MGKLFESQYDPDATDKNTRAQQTNPNTPVVATTPKTELAPTEQLKTNAPDNANIVPVSTTDMAKVNKGLLTDYTFHKPETQGESLLSSYGISSSKADIEKETQFQQLRDLQIDKQGEIYQKDISTLYMDPKRNQGLKDFATDSQKIYLDRKITANSGAGLDIDLGPSYSDTMKIMNELIDTAGQKGSVLDYNSDFTNAFIQAQKGFLNVLNIYKQGGSVDETILEDAVAKLKLSMTPLVSRAVAVGYNNLMPSDQQHTYNQFVSDTKKLMGFYQQSPEGLKDTLSTFADYSNQKILSYKKLTELPSYNAKQKLKQNVSYNEFLNDVAKNNPEKSIDIERWKQSNIIEPGEKKFIDDVLLGPNGYGNLTEARKTAIEQFGVFEGTAMFKDFNDIFEIKKIRYETAEDDYLSGLKTSKDYSKVGTGLIFDINSGGMTNYQSSGQTKTGAYTAPKGPIGGYGTVTHGSNG